MLPAISAEMGVVFDPELRFNDSGNAWVKIRGAAADRAYNPETKEWEQKGDTTYLDIIVGGKQAEHIAESITVGDQIIVHGELVQKEWTTNEGEKRTSYQIRARSIGVSMVGGPAKTRRVLGDTPQQGTAKQSDEAPF
jgi:single-strand DNA-binding protein